MGTKLFTAVAICQLVDQGKLKLENRIWDIFSHDLKAIDKGVTEAISQLFDPFYRVDKSRSRHTGGSGLGLYIVKNILEMRGFNYHLQNSKEGVIFTIKFPLK